MEKIDTAIRDNIKIELRNFITKKFLSSSGQSSFNNMDSFMEKGIIDSTGILYFLLRNF